MKQKQKQKQKQTQRVVVNINQAAPKSGAKKRAPPRQQVMSNTFITTSGSVPQSAPVFNPVHSFGGFIPQQPMPTSLGAPIELSAPVEVPVFAGETPTVIGGEQVSIPVIAPVMELTPVPVREQQPIIVPISPIMPAVEPVVVPRPPSPPTPSIISTPSQISGVSEQPSSQLISQPTKKKGSISSLLKDISKDVGLNEYFRRKPEKPSASLPSSSSTSSSSTSSSTTSSSNLSTLSGSLFSVEDMVYPEYPQSTQMFYTKETMPIASPPSLSTISTRPSFYNTIDRGMIVSEPIIVQPREVVTIKKPELKRGDPYNVFSDNESNRSIASEKSLEIIPQMGTAKPIKKRPPRVNPEYSSSESDTGANIIPLDKPAGRRLPPIPEKKGTYQSLAELQSLAGDKKIDIKRPSGKNKTRQELRLEILG